MNIGRHIEFAMKMFADAYQNLMPSTPRGVFELMQDKIC